MNFIQKIRDYNFQKYMKEYYRESRDLWMSATISKARELELMERVADNWQAKLIEQNAIIGKRIKFSVGHNHITITIGNPVTLIESFNKITVRAYSKCSHKDVYNWKKGVIQAVENFCEQHEISNKQKREIMKALAKKYPEVFK
jgi:hypothetical protein